MRFNELRPDGFQSSSSWVKTSYSARTAPRHEHEVRENPPVLDAAGRRRLVFLRQRAQHVHAIEQLLRTLGQAHLAVVVSQRRKFETIRKARLKTV